MGIGVSIVVAEPAYRAALIAVINSADDMEFLSAHASAAAALPEVVSSKPDIVLIVLTSRDVGERVIGQIRAESPKTAVIALADSRESQDILRVLSVGARGYLLKSSCFTAICDAIRQTARGGSVLSPEIAPTVLSLLRSEEDEAISEREQQVIDLLRMPARNKQIAIALNLSVPTVRTHLRTIYLKLRVRSRSEAIRKLQAQPALRRGAAKSALAHSKFRT